MRKTNLVSIDFLKCVKLIAIGGVACQLMACSSLLKEQGADKEFFMRKVLVLEGPGLPQNGFRKIQRTEPVVSGDRVIYGHAYAGAFAYNLETGTEVWKVAIPEGVEASGAVFKDNLYFGGLDGKFRSVNLKTGAVNWEFSAKSEIVAQPTFDAQNGHVFFIAGNNILYSLNAENGNLRWQYNRPETTAFSIRGGGRPAINDKYVFAGFSDGSLVCLDINNGSVLWENQISKAKKFQDLDSAPILDGNLVITAGFEGALTALNQTTGAQTWQIPLAGLYADPIADAEKYYLASPQGVLTAIRKSDGQKIWEYKNFRGVPTKPALTRGYLLIGDSAGPIQAIDAASGKKIGQLDLGRGITSALAVDPEKSMAYFSTPEGHFYSIEFGFRFPYWISYLISP